MGAARMNGNNQDLFLRRLRVLIVEDNRMSAELLYELIGGQCERAISRTGDEAILKYKLYVPDIVFLDLKLSGDISGLDVLKQIRSVDPNKYVVVVSGNNTKENVEFVAENKIMGFIVKPYSRDKITKHIDNVISILKKERVEAQSKINEDKLNA